MIVISGALVLLAAVLLVLGIISSITLVYVAIGLSLVSAAFLLAGVFQRPVLVVSGGSSSAEDDLPPAPVRMAKLKEPTRVAAVAEPEPESVPERSDAFDDVDSAADYPLEAASADLEKRAESTGADVLVISGRPRYHLGGCEYVNGHEESEPLDIVEARELGFTPCGVCRPNETLALSASGRSTPATVSAAVVPAVRSNGSKAESQGAHAAPATAEQTAVVAAPPVSQPVAPTVLTPPPVAEPASVAAPTMEPAKPREIRPPRKRASRAKKPPVEVASAAESAVTDEASPEVEEAPTVQEAPKVPEAPVAAPPAVEQAPVAAAPAPTRPAAAARPRVATRSVLAVAVTKEYHRTGCVLLDGVDADELTKAAAIRQGFLACGVCKP